MLNPNQNIEMKKVEIALDEDSKNTIVTNDSNYVNPFNIIQDADYLKFRKIFLPPNMDKPSDINDKISGRRRLHNHQTLEWWLNECNVLLDWIKKELPNARKAIPPEFADQIDEIILSENIIWKIEHVDETDFEEVASELISQYGMLYKEIAKYIRADRVLNMIIEWFSANYYMPTARYFPDQMYEKATRIFYMNRPDKEYIEDYGFRIRDQWFVVKNEKKREIKITSEQCFIFGLLFQEEGNELHSKIIHRKILEKFERKTRKEIRSYFRDDQSKSYKLYGPQELENSPLIQTTGHSGYLILNPNYTLPKTSE